MTFLQPWILWALPLALIPILIHLINRMRHRSIKWAAMMFLLSANRSSTRYAKLRQFLILALRVISILALLIALSRPIAGGWLGWMLSPAPDMVVILFDRSASMENADEGGSSKRKRALQLLSQAAKPYEETTRFVLLESALKAPQEIAGAQALPDLLLVAPTDTAADLPSMLQTAADWLVENHAGNAEIWIASDLQRSNWSPESDRWPALASKLTSLPQSIRVRLLSLNQGAAAVNNASIAVHEATRRNRAGQAELDLSVDIQRAAGGPATIPVGIIVDGVRSSTDINMEGQNFRFRHHVNLGEKTSGGWGMVELPADGNNSDNTSYFVYGSDIPLNSAVVSADTDSRRYLKLAAAPSPREMKQTCEIVPLSGVPGMNWKNLALIIWQDALPQGDIAARLQSFVEQGGVVIFFPSDQADAATFAGVSWGEVQTAGAEKPFHVSRWDENDGPLSHTDEGGSLPITELKFTKRRAIADDKNAIAWFEDGKPFLTRHVLGKGQIYFCASAPKRDWSSMGEGSVLVPMMQRLLASGGRHLGATADVACGDWRGLDLSEHWTCMDSSATKDLRTQAGVYRLGDRTLAVNRPLIEDEPDKLEAASAKELFGDVSVRLFEETQNRSSQMQGEMWRSFVFAMLAFLLAEAILILPEKNQAASNPNSPDEA